MFLPFQIHPDPSIYDHIKQGIHMTAIAPARHEKTSPQNLPDAGSENPLRPLPVLSQQIGPRPSGAPAYLRAVEYVEGQLRALGYAVARQPFNFLYFEARGASLQVVGGEALRPVVLEYSAATPAPGMEAPLVPTGLGRREEVQRAGVEGRIALVQRGEIAS